MNRVKVPQRTKFILLFFLMGVGSVSSHAQSIAEEIPTEHADYKISVTGTKTIKSIKDGPVKTDLVTEKDISKNHYRNAAEAILDIPGVTIGGTTGKVASTAIMQGLGGDRVLVLIDGIPLAQNNSGGFDLAQIPTTDIQRIEVVKGGVSSLYGGQAMGGVINIITKRPKEKLSFVADVLRDNYFNGQVNENLNYNSFNAQVSKKIKKDSFRVSASDNQSASVDRDRSTISRDTPGTRKTTAGLWYQRDLNVRHHLIADYSYYDEENTSYFSRLLPNSSVIGIENLGKIQTHRARLGYNGAWSENLNFTFFVFHEQTKDLLSMEDNPVTPYDESLKTSKLAHNRSEAQWDYTLDDNSHIVTFGLVGDQNILDQNNVDVVTGGNQFVNSSDVSNKKAHVVETYVQDDWMLGQIEIVSGVRYTRDNLFGDNYAPKVNLSYAPKIFSSADSIFRASYGTGYRIPTLKERYYVLDHRSFANYIVVGNENLLPERSKSFSLGAEFTKADKMSLTINAFVNNVTGLVSTAEVPTGTNEQRFTYVNLDEARIRGLELGATYYLNENFRVHHSFTYTRAEDQATGLIIMNRPFYVAQTNLRYEVPRLKSNFIYTFRYFGDAYGDILNTEQLDAYSVSDLRWNYNLDKHSQLYLGMLNIFDIKKNAQLDNSTVLYDQRPALGAYLFIGFRIEG